MRQGSYTNMGDNRSWSAFFDITYDISDELTVSGGLRYIDESRESGFAAIMPDSQLLTLLGQLRNPCYRRFLPEVRY